MTRDFQGHVALKLYMSSWIKIVVLLHVSLNDIFVLNVCQNLFLITLSVFSRTWIACRSTQMPRVSNSLKDYGVSEVECKRKWFRELLIPCRCVQFFQITTCFILNSVNGYCSFSTGDTARIASLALDKIQKCKIRFCSESFCLKPIITLRTA